MFGWTCPLPLRLSADAATGVSAAQFKRLAADVLAMRRTRPVARLTFTQAATPTIAFYSGVNGSGSAFEPTITTIGTGESQIDFPIYYEDRLGRCKPITLVAAKWSYKGATPRIANVTCTGNNSATVTCQSLLGSPVNLTLSIAFYGCWDDALTLDDYGAADDKEDVSEEIIPYAWTWYQELEGMLGSAFTTARTGYVHAQKLALARLLGAGLQRAQERLACNLNPASADDMLGVWAKVFRLDSGESIPRWETRQDCVVRMRLLSGITPEAIDSAAQTILGDLYLDSHRNTADELSSAPEPTFWPGGDPGDPDLGLCGYQWTSARAHVWFEVTRPPSVLNVQYHHMMDVRLFRLLDLAMPAHASFNWATSDGFILDESFMDYDSL